ncbi:hypothetical protein EC2865200_5263 [Escherichia coli 2865200]|nr:hypothetical protein EC2865200_5263 [Escherichia coli 2865200]
MATCQWYWHLDVISIVYWLRQLMWHCASHCGRSENHEKSPARVR